MEARAHTARTAYYDAAALMLAGKPFKKQAAIAKLVASEAAMDNARDATQIHGGYGFMNEYPVARHYRDSKILEIGEGTTEVQLMLIAREAGPVTATTEPKRIVQRGLWFEEFEIGAVYEHRPGRTVTEADNVLFTTLTMNTQALHLDAAFSEQTPPFGERLVNSMFTLSTLVGLSVAQLTQGTIVANLGFSEICFPKPLFHGDTLYAETMITDKRESKSRPGEGIVTLAHTGRNQHGDVVAIAVRKTLVQKKPS